MLHGEFLKEQIISNHEERGKLKVKTNGGEAIVESGDHVKDECAIRDLVEIAVRTLEVLVVVGDGKIALDEVVELCVKEKGAPFTFP